jgi:hypothetical protein
LRQMQHRIESDSNFAEYMVKMDSMLGITWDVKVENIQ